MTKKVIAASVLAVVMLVVCIVCSLGVESGWSFKFGGTEEIEEIQGGYAITPEGELLSSGKVYDMPESLALYVDEGSYVSVTLRSRLAGSVGWNAVFESGYEATDMVNVVPKTSNTAEIRCFKPLEKPIKIVASSNETKEYCTLEYIKCPQNLSLAMKCDFETPTKLEVAVSEYDKGTVLGEPYYKTIAVTLYDEFIQAVKDGLTFDITFKSYTLPETALSRTAEDLNAFVSEDIIFYYSNFIEDFYTFDIEHRQAIFYAWYKGLDDYSNHINGNIKGFAENYYLTYEGGCSYKGVDLNVTQSETTQKDVNQRKKPTIVITGERYGKAQRKTAYNK